MESVFCHYRYICYSFISSHVICRPALMTTKTKIVYLQIVHFVFFSYFLNFIIKNLLGGNFHLPFLLHIKNRCSFSRKMVEKKLVVHIEGQLYRPPVLSIIVLRYLTFLLIYFLFFFCV